MSNDPLRFNTMGFSASITRAANTTAYAARDALLASDNSGFVFGTAYSDTTARTNPNLAPLRGSSAEEGRSVVVNSLKLVSSNPTSTVFQGWLHLFSSAITGTDNAAFAPTLLQLQNSYLGKIFITYEDWMNYSTGNVFWKPNLDMLVVFPEPANWSATTGQIWGVLEASGAYTPTSGEVIKAELNITRD